MTWREWGVSEYNTINDLEIGTGIVLSDDILDVIDEIIKNALYCFHDIGETLRDLHCINGTTYYNASEPVKYDM